MFRGRLKKDKLFAAVSGDVTMLHPREPCCEFV
jgi:hypothetical protein